MRQNQIKLDIVFKLIHTGLNHGKNIIQNSVSNK